MIKLTDVSYSYSETTALNGINFEISKGESVIFIGPNGCGKSTLMKLINGIILPDKGIYLFNGEEITLRKLKNPLFSKVFHQKIGFVFQNSDTQLFCPSVYDEIAFGPRQMGLDENEVDKRVYDCMNLLGIERLKYRQPYHLSGGEKKKAAIAAVLALNPEVLVLDEPMNGLDPKTKRFLSELILELNKAQKTILYSTHNFESMEGVFKRALVLSDDHTLIRDDDWDSVMKDREFLSKANII